MSKICPSFCAEVFFELTLEFFLELSMVLGVHVVLCITETNVWKIMFCSQNGESRANVGFFQCIGKFSYHFFLDLVYNESLY